MRVLRIGILGMAAALAAILGSVYLMDRSNRETLVPLVQIGGEFQLASSKGGVVRSQDLKGQPYAVFFGFTHCPEVCPTTLYEMSTVLETLGDAARDFRVFFVTVDPERDTVPVLKDYLANFDPRMEALVPTLEELPRITRDFRVFYAKVPTSDGAYTMDHTASVFLMDAEGQFSGTISFGEASEMRLGKLKKLLGL